MNLETTQHAQTRQHLLDTLAKLGSLTVAEDNLRFEGTAFILPEQMKGRVDDAIEFLRTWQDAQSKRTRLNRTFRYRPLDGAAAFDRAMRRLFGASGIGQSTKGMMGEEDPQLISVPTGLDTTIQVPWGDVGFSPLEAVFSLGSTKTPEDGWCFQLSVNTPRKYRQHIEAFFNVVQDELDKGSIYRGKAITAAQEPGFIDTSVVDRRKVVYSEDVMTQLDANVWSVIRHADVMKEIGLPVKRQVLLYGPYGTGKTSAGVITAQEAVLNGWTYIQVRPGDDLFEALKTAQLYGPAVLLFEDIDIIATNTGVQVSKILDALDGVTNKGAQVIALFTTNHVDSLHKGLMRPGRLDAVVELGGLDIAGARRLVEVKVPQHLLDVDGTDWEAVGLAYAGLLPAFATEAIDRAQRYAIARSGGVPQVISGTDLISAAHGIRAQVKMMDDAPEIRERADLNAAFAEITAGVLAEHVVDYDGDNLPIKRQ